MTSPQQNEMQYEIEQFDKDINLLQDKLKKLKNEEWWISKMKNGPKKIAKNDKIHKEKSKLKRR